MLNPTDLTAVPLDTPTQLVDALLRLRHEVDIEGRTLYDTWQSQIARRGFCISALNLVHYIAFRRRELRQLQAALMPWGVSSLGRSEGRVIANLDATISTLQAIISAEVSSRVEAKNSAPSDAENEATPAIQRPSARRFYRGDRMLTRHTEDLFGAMPLGSHRQVRIMVTFPTEAATDYEWVRDVVARGMDSARINCAHDDAVAWQAMIHHIRRAQAETGREVKIHMDLGGPKARTGEVIAPGKTALQIGDMLRLTRGAPKKDDRYPFQAESRMPEIFEQLKPEAQLWIDDGKMGTQIDSIDADYAVLRVTHVGAGGYRLKPEKGMNFPGSTLRMSALTADDLCDLDFVAYHADSIGYSFVQDAEDMRRLQMELEARIGDLTKIGIIAKIETARAVQNLPEIIVAGAGKQPFGVMIARGDLAVEIGFERMAEIQEELLWLCEAAHTPVVWATQVLERFVKKGTPTRAEMTDAAAAVRAECVMLNKGPYVREAITILDDVLIRMQNHLYKKSPQLRALRAWQNIIDPI